jgi:hypothetical protein
MAFEKLLPIEVDEKTGLLPFERLLKVYRITQPRLVITSIDRRRELYKAKNWVGY